MIKPVLALLALFAGAMPLSAGGIERFLLPRTTADRAYDVAATDTYAWMIAYTNNVVAKVNPDGTVADVMVLSSWADKILADPVDGSLWFANYYRLGHLTVSGESVEYDLPFPQGTYQNVEDFILGPDDHFWIMRSGGDLLRVSRDGQVDQFAGFGGYGRLAAGPDGNIWATYRYSNDIARITPSGTRTLFSNGPADAQYPAGITTASDGKLWFVASGRLKNITTAGVITEVLGYGGGWWDIVAGADGALWFNESSLKVTKFDIGSGTVAWSHTLPSSIEYVHALSASTSGVWWGGEGKRMGLIGYDAEVVNAPFLLLAPEPWGSAASSVHIWFTAPNDNLIGRLTPADGHTVFFPLPNPDSRPLDIVAGTDAMWFTEETGDRIGRIVGDGVVQEFPVPTPGSKPTAITFGGDGNFWFTLAAADKVVRLTPGGVFTEFPLPTSNCGGNAIASGSDGNLWLTCKDTDQIVRVTLAGVVTGVFPAGGREPSGILAAPDGNLWYSTWVNNFRLTPAGVVTKFDFPAATQALERVVGPDGAMWDTNYNTIVQTTLDGTSHHFYFEQRVNGRTIVTAPDGHLWFSDSNARAFFRLTQDTLISATGSTVCPQSRRAQGALATFFDPGPGRPVSSYSARIDWSDGTYPQSGQISPTGVPGQFVVSGGHTFDTMGPRSIKVTFAALPGPGAIGQTAVAFAFWPGMTAIPSATSFYREGGTGTIDVTAAAECVWSAQRSDGWITFNGGSQAAGQGSKTIAFEVQPYQGVVERTTTIYIAGVEVSVTQTAASDPASSLYLITPCRLVDTRDLGVPQASGTITRRGAALRCGIPADAAVIAANVTVINPGASGWLALFPSDSGWTGVSSVNYRLGRTRANNVLVKLKDGMFDIMNVGADVHYAIDVTGYFQ
jgi:virginiamycin B lyase